MKLTGAEIIVKELIRAGVDTVFGYPGGQVIPLYDALYKEKGNIRHILTAHEQGASHAADGYARTSGKVGVCIATSGPGATNLVTGLATAYMDSSPVVAITGNVPLSLLGRDSFQEVDITGVTMPVTKHNWIIKRAEDIVKTIRMAFKIASSGRPGPVLVDVPKDLQVAEIEYDEDVVLDEDEKKEINKEDLDKAIRMIESAKRPFFYIGGGVIRSDSSELLNRLLELTDSATCSTLMALGAVKSRNPRFTGMVGMHGTKLSNMCVNSCDLLIVCGARFSDRVISNASTFARQAEILQLDVDPAEIDKNIYTSHHVIGDIKEILSRLISHFDSNPLDHHEWIENIQRLRERYPMKVTTESRRSREVLKALEKILPENNVITTEVGQHQMWAAQFLKTIRARRFLTSGGLGTMGFGTGAAIGAQMARPDARVVNIAGDGSFRMNMNELATISRYNLPVVILIMNNHALGMVRQWQTLFYDGRYSETTLSTPVDWIKLASAFSIEGRRLSLSDDPGAVLEEVIAMGKACVVDVEIPLDDKVLPMVAPGASINDMIGFIDNEDFS
ncbi:MAG TPA: biosynthetic-type acetolactate synthase large subunit [Candidatus Ornithospirochaeta avicola]|uniref:Acetolactate synthase n=1 Tax=Candidatus Ornithospirochaeta avicola TaxID=2840896 RepID=A0A9D1PUA3_9SPIO|nr:biosynthetic-type acetolactate synthase large subunit [Candidatus Ornithospirochaeta avicola]